MSTTVTTATDPSTDPYAGRRVPRFGGFSPTLVGLELRRVLRNRRTIVFALVLPTALYLVFGSDTDGAERVGDGNLAAYLLISMALYGGALVAAAAGANVAVERAQGWSRQLRLTPLRPVVYVGIKTLVAVVTAAVAIGVVQVVGLVQGTASMPAGTWVACVALTLVCTLTFAALGLFAGYLLPSENVMQVLGPGLALLSFLGGVFLPLSEYSEVVRQIAYWTPMYGVAEVSRAPLTGSLPWYAVVNTVAWLAVFVAGAAWRMSRDTDRT